MAIFTHYQNLLRHTLNFPIFLYYPQSAPTSLSKSNAMDGFTFAWDRNNPFYYNFFPSIFFVCSMGTLFLSILCNVLIRQGQPDWQILWCGLATWPSLKMVFVGSTTHCSQCSLQQPDRSDGCWCSLCYVSV